MRHITESGIALIKRYEGFSSKPYFCPAGILTIGYGHTGLDVHKGMVVTPEEAAKLLAIDVQSAESSVLRLIKRPLTDNQFNALVSFVFNLGAGRLQSSTLRQKCNRTEDDDVPAEFKKWVYASGRKLPGLVSRRASEANMYAATAVKLVYTAPAATPAPAITLFKRLFAA